MPRPRPQRDDPLEVRTHVELAQLADQDPIPAKYLRRPVWLELPSKSISWRFTIGLGTDAMAEVDLVLKWQQSVSQDRYADDQPLVSHLYAVCSDFYAELVSQIGADQKTDPTLLLRLQRSHSYLILWADGYGVAQGQLDSSLDRSRRAKQSTINLLISICQTLTKREMIPSEHVRAKY